MTRHDDDSAYSAANLARAQSGLKPFGGIEHYRRGFDQAKIEDARSRLSLALANLEASRNDPARWHEVATLEGAAAALHRELWEAGG